MLKWLQSGVYHTSNVNEIITDDPLATLNFKDEVSGQNKLAKIALSMATAGQPTGIQGQKEIYSVSR